MAGYRPIDIDALDADTLSVARAAADAAGMSLEDWLASTLGADTAPGSDESLTEAAPASISEESAPHAVPTGESDPPPDLDETIVAPSLASQPRDAESATPPAREKEPAVQTFSDRTDTIDPPDPGPPNAGDDSGADDLHAALQALAGSLSTATLGTRWAARVDRIRQAAASAAPADSTPYAPKPAADLRPETRPTPVETPPPAPNRPEPRLDTPPVIPPAPAVEHAPEPESESEQAREIATLVPLSKTMSDGELEKAIAAAQERRRIADETGQTDRRRATGGGWLVRSLIGLLAIAAIAILGVLIYVWLTPSATIQQVTDDLSDRASSVYASVADQIDEWIGGTDETTDTGDMSADAEMAGETPPAESGEGGTESGPASDVPGTEDTTTVGETDDGGTALSLPAEPDTTAGSPEGLDGQPIDGAEALPADEPADVLSAELSALVAQAESGDPAAQRELAKRYLAGDGVIRDAAAAHEWLQEASVGSDPEAEYLLGTLYEAGDGIEQDPLLAMAWYMSAAESGQPDASLRLGRIYRDGDLWPQSYPDAAEQFRRAADLGSADAEFELANLYNNGLGVERSPLLAYTWFSRAAEHGHIQAAEKATELAAQLTPEQLAQSAALTADPPLSVSDIPEAATPISSPDITPSTDNADAAGTQTEATIETPVPVIPDEGVESGTPPASAEDPLPVIDGPEAIATLPTPSIVPDTPGTDEPPTAETATTSDLVAVSPLSTEAIQEIQTLLNALGYNSGRPDGIPGRRTAQAIQAYQQAEGLTVTGEATLSLLGRLRTQAQ